MEKHMNGTIQISAEEKILNHPWYRKWECGEVSPGALQTYAQEYYWQVAQFPRYLSALHSQLDSLEDRQLILRNLSEEENEQAPHPELWLDFAEALGLSRAAVKAGKPGVAAQALVQEFRSLTSTGNAEALGAIYAYEAQVPEVAKFKQAALRSFYLSQEKAELGTRFFSVHEEADVWHSQEIDSLIAKLSPEEKARAQAAASRACQALRTFLNAMPD
jgi:pyrroloquinoline-quinone synthase